MTVGSLVAICALPASGFGLDFRTYEFAAPVENYTDIEGPAVQSARVESYDDGRLSFTIRLNRALTSNDTLRLGIDSDNDRATGETFIRYGRDLDIVLQANAWGLQRSGESAYYQVPISSMTLSSPHVYLELDARHLGIAPGTTFGVSFETSWQVTGESGSYISLLPDYIEDPWWALVVPTMGLVTSPPLTSPAPVAPSPVVVTAPQRRVVPIRVQASELRRGRRVFVRLHGSTKASERGRQVLVEHKAGKRHVRLCTAKVARNGRFSATCRVDQLIREPQTALRLRVRLPRTGSAEAATRSLVVRVSAPRR